MPSFTQQLNVSHLSAEKSYKCVLKPSDRAHFSMMIDLRDHMPSCNLKMNGFPSIS